MFTVMLCVLGGAGGKGVWGKPGSELEETSICQDINDPNYDSDSQVSRWQTYIIIIRTHMSVMRIVAFEWINE